MNYLDIFQLVGSAVSLLLTMAASIVLAVISYMIKRRDKDLDRIVEIQAESNKKISEHDVKLVALQGELKLLDGMKTDIREIRDVTNKMSVVVAKIEQKLEIR